MKRAAPVLVAAAAFLASCRPAGPPPVVEAGLPEEEPMVRIGVVVDTPEVTVSAAGEYEILDAGGEPVATASPEESWRFSADDAGRLLAHAPDGRRLGPFEGLLRIRVDDEDDPVLIAGSPYRGGALIRAAGPGRVTAVNLLALEAYLLGVVPREIGVRPEEEMEAMKAQAVAARTYAIGHLGNRESLGFDFYATVSDQVYGGLADEHPRVSRAVRETRGEVITYQGQPILAYYHSTCGGRTAAIDEVWHHAPLPYLKSVSDRVEGTEDRYYCETSSRFRWTESWSGEELREILTASLAELTGSEPRPIEEVQEVEILGFTPSGRVDSLRVTVDDRTYVVQGDRTRRVLWPEPGRLLNSALFVLDEERDDGEVTALEASGGGWGHGIGMCQVGAMGRARAGQDYHEILTTYYQGTDIVQLY